MNAAIATQEAPETLRLLEELATSQDFPAISQVIAQVNRIVASDNSHSEQLTDSILKDVSLTNKLLRLVNSAQFGSFGNNPISTISRAVVILGYDAVRDTALSLLLFEHLENHAQAEDLKSETIESFYCGVIGRMLARRMGHRDTEEVFICSLFRNLGKLMARLHFYPQSRKVDQLMAKEHLSESAAARRVFGLSYDEIGQAIGRHWHLPGSMLEGMSPLPDGPVKPPTTATGRMQVYANLSRELYSTMKATQQEDWGRAIADICQHYAKAVDLPGPLMVELLYEAGEVAEKEVAIMHGNARSSPLMRRLLEGRKDQVQTGAEPASGELPAAGSSAEADGDPNGILINGLQEMSNMLLDNAGPQDLLLVMAELMYRTHCFDNVVISTVDIASKSLVGRIGHGAQANKLRAAFRIPMSFTPDVFHAAIGKGVDILISDTAADNIRDRIPDWYKRLGGAKSFLLLPLVLGKKTAALVYADRRDVAMQLSPQTLGLIKSLRNQATLALRQKFKLG